MAGRDAGQFNNLKSSTRAQINDELIALGCPTFFTEFSIQARELTNPYDNHDS